MNRVVYIIGQEPDENDLIITGKEIVRSFEIERKNNFDEFYKKEFVI